MDGAKRRAAVAAVAVVEPPIDSPPDGNGADDLAMLRQREKRLLRLARIVAGCDIVQAGRDPSLIHKAVSVRWIREQARALLTHDAQKERAREAEGAADGP